jgi:hypothetical protein
LHARIGRDLGELRVRWTRWTALRRAADARRHAGAHPSPNPEDIVNVAFRTFRAVRMLQDALGATRTPAATLALLLRLIGRSRG